MGIIKSLLKVGIGATVVCGIGVFFKTLFGKNEPVDLNDYKDYRIVE